MERRGRIPIAKFRTQEGKTRSRSRVREPDYNDQDPDTNLFTLIEDNIALKEENAALKLQLEDQKKLYNNLFEDNRQQTHAIEAANKQQSELQEEITKLNAKLSKVQNERNSLDKLHKIKAENINSLSQELQTLQLEKQKGNASIIVTSNSLKAKFLKLLPALSANTDMESIVETDATLNAPITSDLLEKLVDEFMSLKISLNSVELQLYEGNEKIAELIENQHHMEEENEHLRTENANLTKVAKLLTENMKESVETSKKMEAALIKLKQRNDELVAKNRDITDGQTAEATTSPTTEQANKDFEQIKDEIESQNRDHGERIVEMQNLLEAAIEKSTNDELKTLQIKLSILEDELRNALARATAAETELEMLRNLKVRPEVIATDAITLKPPPPPPPMPVDLLFKAPVSLRQHCAASASTAASDESFAGSIAMHNLHKTKENAVIETVKQQVQPEVSTGLDALVREFKSGRVTLRRNRRKTHTNEALQEMFQVLEISQKQNRNSKICVNMNLP